uniref:Uncharacterized protein n=1 Tax=Setaria viridis TaxID=4556 RepID=A0A4U6SX11_SETVI|nr:hypothetical protein SEVIR_9G224400v2 [Setaria viridis]
MGCCSSAFLLAVTLFFLGSPWARIHLEVPPGMATMDGGHGSKCGGGQQPHECAAPRCRLLPSLPTAALAHVSQLRPGLPLLRRYTTRVCPRAWLLMPAHQVWFAFRWA